MDGKQEPYRPVFLSDNAITLSNKVQLVIRFYGDPAEIHRNYDFIHCCNYWTPDEGVMLNPLALESILTKNLQYQGSAYPVCSVIRMRKFLKAGWHINAGQILKMLFQISALDLTDIEVLEEQLTGVDAAYFYQVIEYCKKRLVEEPDFKVTAPYLCSIIDKIWGSVMESKNAKYRKLKRWEDVISMAIDARNQGIAKSRFVEGTGRAFL